MTPSPSITVIIVNLNGREVLGGCLDSLAAQRYDAASVQVVMVDNGSTDDSVSFVREHYPHVTIVETGRNWGFAAANNIGAHYARGEYLALINNDMVAHENWLSAMIGVCNESADIACVGAKILNWDGTQIDFSGSVMNTYGRAFHLNQDKPSDDSSEIEPRELLAPCGGAMLIRRSVFQEVGGFDADYIAYFEDLDLGWRLWLHGYRILFAPDAVVYHHQHATGLRFPVEQRYFQSELNALRTIIKNYSDESLVRVLPFSLFMAVKRSLDQAGLDRTVYHFGNAMDGDPQGGYRQSESSITKVAASLLVAIDQIADELPQLLHKRQAVQKARRRSDQEIFTRFPLRADNPIFPWRHFHVAQQRLAQALDLPTHLRPSYGRQLLIITHETIGPRLAGPGIRAWEMACALSKHCPVVLAAPGVPNRAYAGLSVVGYAWSPPYHPELEPYIIGADVIMTIGPVVARMPALQDLNKPLIVDLYDPFELEKLAQSDTVAEQFKLGIDLESMTDLRVEATAGDFFVCASERQRDFWLGVLLAAGRINAETYAQDATLRRLIDVVPFGMPAEPPLRRANVLKGIHPGIGADDKLLLWNGGLWQWFDPFTLVDALMEILRVRNDVKLYFAAGTHFDVNIVPEMPVFAQLVERCRALDILDRHVFIGDWVSYDERADYLLEADLGISISKLHLESRFASRSRLMDCIWAGLPIVATAGDPVSDFVAEQGLGRTVPPGDAHCLAQTILAMLDEPDLKTKVSENTKRYQVDMSWPAVIEPIAKFMNNVAYSADALQAARNAGHARQTAHRMRLLQDEVNAAQQTQAALLAERDAIQQERDDWRAERDDLRTERDDLRQELVSLRRERDDLGQQAEKARNDHALVLQAYDQSQQERDGLARQIQRLQLEILTLQHERDNNGAQLVELREHVREIQQGLVMRVLRSAKKLVGNERPRTMAFSLGRTKPNRTTEATFSPLPMQHAAPSIVEEATAHNPDRRFLTQKYYQLPDGLRKIHVGCSQNYMSGWVNIDFDAGSKADLVHDVTTGMPFRNGSIDVVHSEDFIEHLSLKHGTFFFEECYRILKPGGYMRVLTPDLLKFALGYTTRDPGTLEWYAKNFGCKTFAEAFNFGMRMGGHTFLYDTETLDIALSEAGFKVIPVKPGQSECPELCGIDLRLTGISIYRDCLKS